MGAVEGGVALGGPLELLLRTCQVCQGQDDGRQAGQEAAVKVHQPHEPQEGLSVGGGGKVPHLGHILRQRYYPVLGDAMAKVVQGIPEENRLLWIEDQAGFTRVVDQDP